MLKTPKGEEVKMKECQCWYSKQPDHLCLEHRECKISDVLLKLKPEYTLEVTLDLKFLE